MYNALDVEQTMCQTVTPDRQESSYLFDVRALTAVILRR